MSKWQLYYSLLLGRMAFSLNVLHWKDISQQDILEGEHLRESNCRSQFLRQGALIENSLKDMEQTVNAPDRRGCFGSLVSVVISGEVWPHMTENSRPSPFFNCGKINLVILGISSTRTGLILTGILTMIQHSDPVVLHFLLWNWWGIVGIWSIYGPFRRIPKQHVDGWYSPTLLVKANGHQLK